MKAAASHDQCQVSTRLGLSQDALRSVLDGFGSRLGLYLFGFDPSFGKRLDGRLENGLKLKSLIVEPLIEYLLRSGYGRRPITQAELLARH